MENSRRKELASQMRAALILSCVITLLGISDGFISAPYPSLRASSWSANSRAFTTVNSSPSVVGRFSGARVTMLDVQPKDDIPNQKVCFRPGSYARS